MPQSISGQSTLSVKLFVYTLGVKLSVLHQECQIVRFTLLVSNCPPTKFNGDENDEEELVVVDGW